ncbi:hypothetical protein ACS0TY_022639 [Phlomoides rotata]
MIWDFNWETCLYSEYPTLNDWENHLKIIFPEVRLNRYVEMRGVDEGPWKWLCALPAFWEIFIEEKISSSSFEERLNSIVEINFRNIYFIFF